MKIAHWSLINKSGMNNVADSIVKAEKAIGIDSNLCDINNPSLWPSMYDCDVHVSHTHIPDAIYKKVTKPLKTVWIGHGTPEHVFQSAVEASTHGYGHGDSWMLIMQWMRTANAIVTFWDRHKDIYKSMCDKNTIVSCLPLGLDKEFWHPVTSRGKYAGDPSVYTAENQHYMKWALDIFIMWGPWVVPRVKGDPVLHATYIPRDTHRWFFPLINRNSTSYASHISPIVYGHADLRNVFNSVDYYLGMVRYGDHNRMSLEANASGCKTISYCGNVYSDYWIHEGPHKDMAEELVAILNKEVEPRKKEPVPDIKETALGMKAIYESIL